ncbi:MPN domain-containing protein-like, partial [Corapipo altera]|uniref:MPN domain-containing protein-like n=1 Tax=Corapipo altera TaxID=415028 RepID=UPI000FD62B95
RVIGGTGVCCPPKRVTVLPGVCCPSPKRPGGGSRGCRAHAVCPPQICQSLFLRGLSLVGWYHSHPFGPALPSLHDIDAQMDYQLKLQGSGNGFQPCLGLICGPYFHGNPGVESRIAPFWVMPPPEQRPNDYGIPMEVEVTYIPDGFLTNDVVQEM